MFQLNDKLSKALKRANIKIAEIKDKYKTKVSKKCYYCNNEFEVTMPMGTTMDQIQLSTMNDSFIGNNNNVESKSPMYNSTTQGYF